MKILKKMNMIIIFLTTVKDANMQMNTQKNEIIISPFYLNENIC